MKLKLILLLAGMLTGTSIYAQINIDSCYKIGSTWTEYSETQVNHARDTGYGIRLSILRDTVINAKNYHLLFSKRMGTYNACCSLSGNPRVYDTTQTPYALLGALRVSGRKVYFMNVNNGVEDLLYDFNLNVGDNVYYKAQNKIVQAIDTIQFTSGQLVRRYWFYQSTGGQVSDYWLEGTGSFLGFMNRDNSPFPLGANTFYRSMCYSSGSYEWRRFINSPNAVYNACYEINSITLAVPGISTSDEPIKVFPSPVLSGEINITNTGNSSIKQVIISDHTGKLVLQQENIATTSKNLKLQLPGAAQGILFVSVIMENGTKTMRKIVKL